jgi:lysophospholipase L1-like esterase
MIPSLFWLCSAALAASTTAPAKPAAREIVVAALGDSTTLGTPYPTGSYPELLGKRRRSWHVHNLGVNGERAEQIMMRWGRQVAPLRPNVVVILAGVNDVYQGVPTDDTLKNLRKMYRMAKRQKTTALAATIAPYDQATLEDSTRLTLLNKEIRALAKAEGVMVCDVFTAAADPQNPRKLKGSPDGLHPDRATYGKIADAIEGCIIKALDL